MANDHYTKYEVQPLEFIQEYELNFCEGNIIKYICRAEDKGTREQDIKKAIDYTRKLEVFSENNKCIDMLTCNERFIAQFTTWQRQALILACTFLISTDDIHRQVLIDFLKSQI